MANDGYGDTEHHALHGIRGTSTDTDSLGATPAYDACIRGLLYGALYGAWMELGWIQLLIVPGLPAHWKT